MFGMLEVGFRHDAIAGAAGVAAKLEIFFKQLLRCAAYTQVRPITVKDMVAVQRDLAIIMAYASAIAAARTMVTASHAFHVHKLSQHFPVAGRWRCPGPWGGLPVPSVACWWPGATPDTDP